MKHHKDQIYWLQSAPIDQWERWKPIHECDEETCEKAIELFIKGIKDFSRCIDWDLQRYQIYAYEGDNPSWDFAVGFKCMNNGTVNVFTELYEGRHKLIYHEYDCEWEICGSAYTEVLSERKVKIE